MIRRIALAVLALAPLAARAGDFVTNPGNVLFPDKKQGVTCPFALSDPAKCIRFGDVNAMKGALLDLRTHSDGWVNATEYTGADIGAKVNAAFAANPGKRVVIPAGVYAQTTTISYPVTNYGRAALHLDGAELDYSGTGYAIDAATTSGGEFTANVRIYGSGRIVGTASGLAGVHFRAFNAGRIEGLTIQGFTNGAGILNEGANTVDIPGCILFNNKYGLRNVGVVVGGATYSPNAVRVLGGHVVANKVWGIFDDGSLAGTVGPSIGNVYSTTFDPQAAGASGHVFIEHGSGCRVDSSYLEMAPGTSTPYAVKIGTGQGNVISGSVFLSAGATASIYDDGIGTLIIGNTELAAIPSFIEGGPNSRSRARPWNTALSASVNVTGTDIPAPTALSTIIGDGGPLGIQTRSTSDGRVVDFLNVDKVAVGSVWNLTPHSGGIAISISAGPASAAPVNSVFVDQADGKLKFKDAGGGVFALY